jgi:hypothetical protein
MKHKFNRIDIKKRAASLAALIAVLTITSPSLRANTGSCGGVTITVPFMDVQGGSIFFCSIAEAYFSGLTNGTTATTYSPADVVTREQMAAFITRTEDAALQRGNARSELGQWWTQQYISSTAVSSVGVHPRAVKSDGEFLWVANYLSNTVSRVQASDGKVIQTWTGMTNPSDVLVANGRVYVTGGTTPGKLYAIDPEQSPGNAVLLATIGNNPTALAYDGEHILTANNGGSVTNYHVPSGTQITYTNGLIAPVGMLYDGSSFWVTDIGDDKLKKISISGPILQAVDAGANPFYPTFDGTNIWLPNKASDSVSVVRASTGAVIATLTGNGLSDPYTAAFDGERILVTNFTGDGVSLWQASALKPLGAFSTGAGTNPYSACSDGINFWVAFAGIG